MRCNIDARGKAVRLVAGGAVLGVAALLAAAFFAGWAGSWAGFAALGAAAGGAFMVFESRSGWCVLRAMGLKTPI